MIKFLFKVWSNTIVSIMQTIFISEFLNFLKCFMCSVWVARRPPGYAFIDFDDRRDAQDAIRELDGMY